MALVLILTMHVTLRDVLQRRFFLDFSANLLGALATIISHFSVAAVWLTSQCQAEETEQLNQVMTCKDKYKWVMRYVSV